VFGVLITILYLDDVDTEDNVGREVDRIEGVQIPSSDTDSEEQIPLVIILSHRCFTSINTS
jgi:hypothetical protein